MSADTAHTASRVAIRGGGPDARATTAMLPAVLHVLVGAAFAAPACPLVEPNVEYKQPPHYSEVNTSDAAGCCSRCTADARCRSWSFKASDVAKGIPCRLLDAEPTQRVGRSAFVSGTSSAGPPAWRQRLRVDGARILDPAGDPIRLVGFNWQLGRTTDDDGDVMTSLLEGANVARVVGVLWDNQKQATAAGAADMGVRVGHIPDCMTATPPTYFNDKCFDELDRTVLAATNAGVWVILTDRSAIGAGQHYDTDPMPDVFHNATLRSRFYAMWRHVAAHYAAFDRIAAYEIMAEPRDKDIDPAAVRDFYEAGCAAARAADPRTPCMVGSRPYYKLWTFGPDVVLRNTTNVIYTFDYFVPDDWSFGRESVSTYNTEYACRTLYPGWAATCCADPNAPMLFDASWSADNFARFALPVRNQFDVPLFVNQWGVAYGVGADAGRYAYMRDFAALMQRLDIGWAWWTWRGGGDEGWKHGSMEIVYDYANGTVGVDGLAVAALAPAM